MSQRFSFYAGVFLISGVVMALQILQSRIFSVTSWYHLSFLVISMAMFGLTLGALKVYRGAEEEQRRNFGLIAKKAALLCSFFILFALLVQLFIPLLSADLFQTLTLLPIVAVATSIAYYHAGVAISVSLTRSPYPVGKVYGVDLLGAGLGCLGALALMESIDTPSGLIVLAGMAALASLAFPLTAPDKAKKRETPAMTIGHYSVPVAKGAQFLFAFALLLAAVNVLLPRPILYPLWVKSALTFLNTIDYEEWNSISRVTVLKERKDDEPYLWGPSEKLPADYKASYKWLLIDGDAGTPITNFKGDWPQHGYLEYDITNLAYRLPGRRNAAIIGVGGGRDALSAKYFGVEKVTALDVNPVQIKLLRDHPEYRDYAGLYRLPGLKLINSEARSWFRGNREKFDLIQMSLIDTWAATGAGAFALSENGIYTVEAWSVFLDDLTEDGVFTVSRWSADALDDTGRLLSLGMAALFRQGVEKVDNHIFIASSGRIATLILSKSPFTVDSLGILHKTAENLGFNIIVSPVRKHPEGILGDLLAARSEADLHEISARQVLDVSPPTDMRPFFFNQARFSRPLDVIYHSFASGVSGIVHGQAKATFNLFIVIAFSAFMVGFVILSPLSKTLKGRDMNFIGAGTLYFFLIGFGFMLVEISLLQALGVFLGHPIYGLSVVLFSLIIAAGMGSLLSEILQLRRLPARLLWCALTCAYGIAMASMLNDIFTAYAEVPLAGRAAISVAIIVPAGLLLGFGFPTGMRITQGLDSRATAWFWGINGATGVLGSSIAMALNIALGIDKTLIIGSLCYLLLAVPFVALARMGKA